MFYARISLAASQFFILEIIHEHIGNTSSPRTRQPPTQSAPFFLSSGRPSNSTTPGLRPVVRGQTLDHSRWCNRGVRQQASGGIPEVCCLAATILRHYCAFPRSEERR